MLRAIFSQRPNTSSPFPTSEWNENVKLHKTYTAFSKNLHGSSEIKKDRF